VVIQPQLGHANLGVTSIYLQGIDNTEIIETVQMRPAPVIPANSWPAKRSLGPRVPHFGSASRVPSGIACACLVQGNEREGEGPCHA
jgi:hypothetical protein